MTNSPEHSLSTRLAVNGDLPSWAVVAACALVVVSLGFLVVRELRQRERGGPAILVTGVIALLALLLAVLRPVRIAARESIIGAKVVVLADASRSMALPDVGKTPRSVTEAHVLDELAKHSKDARLFTLGFGDLSPKGPLGRLLAVGEAGIGFAFLAVVISYLPVFYQAFSKREVTISLLDARAGSPPSAGSLLLRLARGRNLGALDRFLQEWERFAAEILEGQLSFPLLSYYRSQHDNQSWLAAMTTILDASALTIVAAEEVDPYQAQLTFAMARHAVVDLAQVFQARPAGPEVDRLDADQLVGLLDDLERAGFALRDRPTIEARLSRLRGLYEPFINALSIHLLLKLPPIRVEGPVVDNWQTSSWMRRARGIGKLARDESGDDHDD